MITLQIKVAILLAISFLVYTLFLQKNRFYKERRIYLLITGICTVALPLVQFFVPKNLPLSIIYIPEIKIYAAQSPPGTQASHSIFQWAEWFYYAGLVIILAYYIVATVRFINIRLRSKTEKGIVYMKENIAPFSFFKTIYLPASLQDTQEKEVVLYHEKAHTVLNHSVDTLMITLLAIFQWFNPFAWLMLKAIKELHEFQADEKTIASGIDVERYCNQVIAQTLGCQLHILVNNFNKHLTLKRLAMLTNAKIHKKGKLKIAIITTAVFMIFVAVALTNCQKKVHKDVTETVHNQVGIPNPPPPPSTTSSKITDSNGEKIYISVDENASFQGSDLNSFRNYIKNQIKFPDKLVNQQDSIDNVIAQFVVNSSGNVEQVSILRGNNKECNAEVIRVLTRSPAWKPAKLNGKKVSQQFVIPVRFKVQK